MKKFLIVALVALFGASAANAQLVKSRTFTETEKKSNTMWFLRVGMAMNNVSFSDDVDGLGAKVGYDFSVGFNKPIANFGLYWGMDLGLSTRGYKASDDDYEESVLAHAVRFSPFTFGYKYTVNDWLKVDVHVGAYLSYDYAGKYKEDDGYDDYDYDLSDLDNYQRFDAGMQVGVGVWFDRFNLDFTYQRGFIDQFESESYSVMGYSVETLSGNSSNFMIRLGVAF